MSAASQLIFLGTYTKDGSKGIYTVRLDSATGALGEPVLAAETPNPTFLTWRPDHRALYAGGEGLDADGKTTVASEKYRSLHNGPCHTLQDSCY